MSVTRYRGQPLPITVEFPSSPLEVYGKAYTDIIEISMNLKKNLATDADDAYLQKLQSTTGVLLDEANHRFTMVLGTGDYGNLTEGTYFLTLNIEVSGVTGFIETDIPDRKVVIELDTNRA